MSPPLFRSNSLPTFFRLPNAEWDILYFRLQNAEWEKSQPLFSPNSLPTFFRLPNAEWDILYFRLPNAEYEKLQPFLGLTSYFFLGYETQSVCPQPAGPSACGSGLCQPGGAACQQVTNNNKLTVASDNFYKNLFYNVYVLCLHQARETIKMALFKWLWNCHILKKGLHS
jgi:hypothetical protein